MAKKVADLYEEKLHLCRLSDEEQRRADFKDLTGRFHKVRRFRNQILHSAFIELKAGGEIMALMRSNPRLIIDPETGDQTMDQEILSETSFQFRDDGNGTCSVRPRAALPPTDPPVAKRVI